MRLMPRPTRCFLAAAAACIVPLPLGAQCRYEVTHVFETECFDGSNPILYPSDMNNHGAVVGYYRCPLGDDVPFLWTPQDGFITLELPQDVFRAWAWGINDAGTICGTYDRIGAGFRGYVYEDGEYTELEPLPGGLWSGANAINNAGQVCGYRSIGGGDGVVPYNAIVWSRSAGFTDLGVMTGPVSAAVDISDTGFVTGWTGNITQVSEAFLWDGRRLTVTPPFQGASRLAPNAVSRYGHVCGSADANTTADNIAFLWHQNAFTLPLPLPKHTETGAHSIHPGGSLVGGASWGASGGSNVLWHEGRPTSLEALIVDDPPDFLDGIVAILADGRLLVKGDREVLILTPVDRPIADLDGDCVVNVHDLLLLLREWSLPYSPADFDGDADVTVLDLIILLENWSIP